jgi:hypothetical protein
MVLLLTVITPPSMSTYLKHNLLFSPTGRRNHFVAKDHWLEVQNYWIKFLFNRSGNGTNIDRLRELLSPNIFLVCISKLHFTQFTGLRSFVKLYSSSGCSIHSNKTVVPSLYDSHTRTPSRPMQS